jgi:type I restriction enzyme S subunit
MEALQTERKVKTQRYPAYKESSEEWIGEIPTHWAIRRLKHIFVEKRITFNPSLSCGSISFGKVITKDDERIPLSTRASYQEVLKGEFLINPLNLNYDLISLRIALSEIDVVISSGYIVIKDIVKLDKKYFKYLLHRYDVAYMKLLGSGVRQTISFNHIANSLLVFPPLSEQSRIAEFLDRKTTQIDEAIAQKERLIELLKERRQVLIHNAVTRGLDIKVKMKDSGEAWIGEIPEHWEVKRLKFFIQDLESGVSVNASESESANEGEIGVLKTSCVYNYVFEREQNKKVFNSELRRVACSVKRGNIIISRMNAPELVGASGYVKEDHPNLFLPDRLWQTVFSDACELNVTWLSYILATKAFRNGITSIASGSSPSMKNISKGDFLNLRTPHPPLDEQNAIVSYVDCINEKISAAFLLEEKQIEKLKEYKSSLINSVVTGKIKV